MCVCGSILSIALAGDDHRARVFIAIRHVRPVEPELIGRHLRDTEAHFYAARSWIERHGAPRSPTDLAGPALLGFDDVDLYAAHLQGIGIPVPAAAFRLVSENSVVIWEMVRRGLGIAAMLHEIAARTPEVIRLLPDLPPIPVPIWLVTHRELDTSRRIRVVHDILAEELSRIDKPEPVAPPHDCTEPALTFVGGVAKLITEQAQRRARPAPAIRTPHEAAMQLP